MMLTYKDIYGKDHTVISISKSETADSRMCDYSKVTKDELLWSSKKHIEDIKQGMNYFANRLRDASVVHDHDKISDIDGFHDDFITNFKTTKWYDNHMKVNRHHINDKNGVPKDVNLVDVIEHIVDCVMAGLARSGKVWDIKIKNDVLQKAVENTVKELIKTVEVENQEK